MRTLTVTTLLVFSANAAIAGDRLPSEIYAHPQTLIAVEGVRRINLYCAGNGTPTVLFDSGTADNMMSWQRVQGEVAKTTRACAYDRAGLGFSDASPHPSDAESAVADIHRLLRAAHLATPIVYVGHSISGLYGVLLAARYPDDIAGEVLVDPAFAHQWRVMYAKLPPDVLAHQKADDGSFIAEARACVALASSGALGDPSSQREKDCLDIGMRPRLVLDDGEKTTLSAQAREPKVIQAIMSDIESSRDGGADDRELDAAKPEFGDKPLVVLTHAAMKPYLMTPAQWAASEKEWNAGHDRLATLSRRGSNTVVSGSGHYIQLDRPEAVIAAIETMVKEINSK